MLSRVVEVVELTWTERRDASFLNVLEASWPQALKDSTTRGMQLLIFLNRHELISLSIEINSNH